MIWFGPPFDLPVVRAFARFFALLGPALFWIILKERKEEDRLRLRERWVRGVAVGIVVSMIWGLIHIGNEFSFPRTTHAWLNVITLSPFAEEVLFRRVAIDHLKKSLSPFAALCFSAVLFSLIHLPWWLLSTDYTLVDTALGLVHMFVYGIAFGLLYLSTKSLWASLIPHCANNLIATSIGA